MKYILSLFTITILGQCHMKKEPNNTAMDPQVTLELIRDLDLAEYNGLLGEFNLSTVRKVFKISDEVEPSSQKFANVFMEKLKSPDSMTNIWINQNKIYCIQINEPQIEPSLKETIGEPDEILNSKLGSATDQHVYFSKGIAAHISSYDNKLKRIYFFKPMDKESFINQSISKVAITRRRRK